MISNVQWNSLYLQHLHLSAKSWYLPILEQRYWRIAGIGRTINDIAAEIPPKAYVIIIMAEKWNGHILMSMSK